MTPRETLGYLLLVVFLAANAGIVWRWRREVRKDRMMRWGTHDSPHQARRRSRRG